MNMTAERVRTCRYHCSCCGQHFTSLRAFDAHRAHEIGKHPSGWTGVVKTWCDHPNAVESLAVAGVGECRLGDPIEVGVTLYEHASAEAAREHFSS